MRTLFISALTCALTSFLGLLGLSATTVVPVAGGAHGFEMLVAGTSLLCWSAVTIWARARLQVLEAPPLPSWVSQTSVVVAVSYVLGFLLIVVG